MDAAQAAVGGLAVDPHLGEHSPDVLASVDAKLGDVAEETLARQTCVVRKGFPGTVEQGLDAFAGQALSRLILAPSVPVAPLPLSSALGR